MGDEGLSLGLIALALGATFGLLAQLSRFCLVGGLRDWWQAGDALRIRAFALALVVALIGTQALVAVGLVPTGRSIYLQAGLSIPAMFVGGAVFGLGMVLANGCGARSLVLLAGGNLRSLVVLLALGIGAYMVLSGVLVPLRTGLVSLLGGGNPARAVSAFDWIAARAPGDWLSGAIARWTVTGVLAAALLAFALPALRRAPLTLLAGAAIGALVVGGWYLTGHLGADDFEPIPVESLTFVAPIGESLLYLMLASGMSAGFGVQV
ncbi:MAG: YeeE/YedE family protein, partial [Gammaproteobacteria bacterium]|nr:YeeE/YedE family protein [Gammaproteobacteria bacterium]